MEMLVGVAPNFAEQNIGTLHHGNVGGRSSAWLEHLTVAQDVAGSNPVAYPILLRASMDSKRAATPLSRLSFQEEKIPY